MIQHKKCVSWVSNHDGNLFSLMPHKNGCCVFLGIFFTKIGHLGPFWCHLCNFVNTKKVSFHILDAYLVHCNFCALHLWCIFGKLYLLLDVWCYASLVR